MRHGDGSASAQRGFAYLTVLAMVAVMGIGLAAVGPMWAEEDRREREDDLLRVGKLYADAIARYYQASPGVPKQYPRSLDALLLDTRFVGTVRHLRNLYVDPIAGHPWGVVRAPDGGIRGVYSQSDRPPLRIVPVDLNTVSLAPATRYADWQFIAKVE